MHRSGEILVGASSATPFTCRGNVLTLERNLSALVDSVGIKHRINH
jgi:hypothetical protein